MPVGEPAASLAGSKLLPEGRETAIFPLHRDQFGPGWWDVAWKERARPAVVQGISAGTIRCGLPSPAAVSVSFTSPVACATAP
jgi:hypothetical protein